MVLIYSISICNFAISEIIPLKKPIQTKEETQKKLLIDVLKPLPKPVKKSEKKIVEEKVIVKKEKKTGLILPKKKPLIAGIEKTEEIKISKIISAVDEEIKTLNCKKESKKGCNNKSSKCITHNLWDQLDQHINSFFEKVKLQDLVKKNQTLNR